MVCGFGACYVCVRTFEVDGVRTLKRVCRDGPVFGIAGGRGMVDLSVKIGDITLQNPVTPASGAFSWEYNDVIDLNRLGGLVAKTICREPRLGNPTPRMAETEAGIIQSIGLPGKGIEYFIDHIVPEYAKFKPPLIVSVSSESIEDFAALAHELSIPDVDVIEANISCPTRNSTGGNFAMHEDHTKKAIHAIRNATNKPLWVKLSPNAGDIVSIAQAAEEAGADCLVIANTFLSLKIRTDNFRPAIGNKFGGLGFAGLKAYRAENGLSGRQSGQNSYHRHRRRNQGRRRRRIHARGRQRRRHRLCRFSQSDSADNNYRRPGSLVQRSAASGK